MDKVADVDPEELWACASAELVQRTVFLARRALRAPFAMLSSFVGDAQVVRNASGFDGDTFPTKGACYDVVVTGLPRMLADLSKTPEAVRPNPPDLAVAAYIGVPVRVARRIIGTLCVMDDVPHAWTQDDLELLTELAASLRCQIELQVEIRQRERAERALDATQAQLLSVADHIPGLVFERRKVDSTRSRYTFFGSHKTSLPAVRQMMEHGAGGSLNFVYRDDRELVRAALLRSNFEETDLDLTFRVKDLDGSLRWVRSQSIVRRGPQGDVGWDGLCFDITDLVAAHEEAETARAAKDALLADVDHDLRARLQAIVDTAASLQGGSEPDRAASQAGRIRSEAKDLLSVLDQMLARAAGETMPMTASSELDLPDQAAHAKPGQVEPASRRILLADDLDLNRKLIADMLSIEGHVVDCVGDGAAAVHAVTQKAYDLVLMDMIMPGMDGVTATRAIRALPGPAGKVPIVALTANSFEEQLDTCMKAGMDATLTKPMSIDALTSAVRTWTCGRDKAA